MGDDRVDIRYVIDRLDHLDNLETMEAFVALEEFKHELKQVLKANEKSRKNRPKIDSKKAPAPLHILCFQFLFDLLFRIFHRAEGLLWGGAPKAQPPG